MASPAVNRVLDIVLLIAAVVAAVLCVLNIVHTDWVNAGIDLVVAILCYRVAHEGVFVGANRQRA